MPRQRQIIPWGSDHSAFSNRQVNSPDNALEDNVAASKLHQADPHVHPTQISAATTSAFPAIFRPKLLRDYRLAYNTVNKFIYCENPGKVGGVCCAGLPINQIFKHLTQQAVRPNSDCIVHGYKIMPAQKATLEGQI